MSNFPFQDSPGQHIPSAGTLSSPANSKVFESHGATPNSLSTASFAFPLQSPPLPPPNFPPPTSTTPPPGTIPLSNSTSLSSLDYETSHLPMDCLTNLSINSASGTGKQPVILHTLDQYISPSITTGHSAAQGDSTAVARLKHELARTKEDLVKAVQGWREDRDTNKKNMEAHIVSNSAKAIKTELLTEKKRMRGEIAKLKADNKECQATLASEKVKYEREILALKAKVLAAETTKSTMRRQSTQMKESRGRDEGEMGRMRGLVESKEKECGDLRSAVQTLMEEVNTSMMNYDAVQSDFDIVSERNEELGEEVERLKKLLESKRPGRKAPPPPRQSFDFGAYSDTKIADVVN